jgi:hypothetical protein
MPMPKLDPAEKARRQRAYQAAYRRNNREEIRARHARWVEEHPEAARAHSVKWRANNPEKKAEYDQHWRTTFPDKHRSKEARRRALKRAAEIEVFEHIEIFERDNWVCQLCEKSIDPTLSWPDPMSASIDHIVPLVKHGNHTRINVQAAHLTCNIRKGSR